MDFDDMVAKFQANIGSAATLQELVDVERCVRNTILGHTIVESEALRMLFPMIGERARAIMTAPVTP